VSADNGYAVIPTEPDIEPQGWGFVMYFASDDYVRPLDPRRDVIYPTRDAALIAAHEREEQHWSEYGVSVGGASR
jgi:hypothetical protein